ncbi:MAG: hypothetical protein N3D80_04790 [Ignavibacterium album]|uniref:hypothetical protein n=1 Tax=Ignavibacterium album TaxID=591197 RepID=UPI0026ED03E3|nr:hypothetical protein [Ignavibacterium album]MCX8105175.1 hypothetical protein [Ignavibacterium album]
MISTIRFIFLFTLLLNFFAEAQSGKMLEGKVSYLSPQLIYLKFESTDGIAINDTLFQKINGKFQPRLIVKFISSISLSCEKLLDFNPKVGDTFFAFIKSDVKSDNNTDSKAALNQNQIKGTSDVTKTTNEIKIASTEIKSLKGNRFSGRYSLQSYSNISNFSRINDYQSWRHSLRVDYEQIGYSGLSFSTYSLFSYRTSEWNEIRSNYFNALKVYDLHLKYEFNPNYQIWLGRFLNPKISNISTVDGLMFEAKFNSFSVGILGGSRPDWKDFSFNPKLLEYGIYLSREDRFSSSFMENTLSFFQQTNNSKTDRRYLYLQHSNNLIKNLNLFASSEIDLYEREQEVEKNQLSFTSVFASAGYYPIRELSFNLSYDARKNVIYYETFKSLPDSIIENEMRQGFHFRTSVKPFKYFSTSVFFGYRYKKSDVKPSRNFGGTIAYSSLPLIESSISLSYNKLISNYVNGDVYAAYLSKTIYNLNSDFSVGYRITKYKFPVSLNSFNENAVLVDYNLNLFRMLSFNFSYEGSFDSQRTTSRFLLGISSRF